MQETPSDAAASQIELDRWLEALCRRTDEVLWDGYAFAPGVMDTRWPRVMFPLKGRERRVSGQEARFAFVAALLSDERAGEWAFAVDVPTRLSYRFAPRGSGVKAQRGLTDLALYRRDQDEPVLAVDFKSGGRSGKSELDESIRKDFAKILAEQPDVLWYHVVRSVNSATLQGLLRTLDAAISRLSNPFRLSDYLAPGKPVEPRAKKMTFHICILDPGMTASIHRVLDYVPGRPEAEFFTIETRSTSASLDIADGPGWSVYRRPAPEMP